MCCASALVLHATPFRHSTVLSPLAESPTPKTQSTNSSKRYANATPVVHLLRSKARCLVVATHAFLAKRLLPDFATCFLHQLAPTFRDLPTPTALALPNKAVVLVLLAQHAHSNHSAKPSLASKTLSIHAFRLKSHSYVSLATTPTFHFRHWPIASLVLNATA